MDYLFEKWNEIEKQLKQKKVFLFLDYDGTLSPIVEKPELATIPPQKKGVLFRIVQNSNSRVAVVSGRSLGDIKKRVDIQGITYSGNHGFETEGPGYEHHYEIPSLYLSELSRVKQELKSALSDFEGIIIEDKELSLSIHYRLLDKNLIPELHSIMAVYYSNKIIKIRNEKMTFEIVPHLAWNKGNAVVSILNESEQALGEKLYPVYLGDTLTDEDAFLALVDIGLTIRVGYSNHTSAQYYVNNVEDVYRFLDKLN